MKNTSVQLLLPRVRALLQMLALPLTLAMLSACGGGGGGDSSSVAAIPVVNGCAQREQSAGADPLQRYQWHLKNYGLGYYLASNLPSVNLDLNLPVTWTHLSGRNVNVTVVDTGMEVSHEDLANNVVCGGSYNFVSKSLDPTNTATDGDHGTSVAGLIAGVANNGMGIAGVAPKANLRAYNFLLSDGQPLTDYAISMGSNASYGAAASDVFNFSAGVDAPVFYPPDQGEDAVELNTLRLRGGKGALIVKSAGNGFLGMEDAAGQTMGMTVHCLSSGVTCQNVNQDPGNTIHSALVVAAVNPDGKKSSYSTAGSAIWVSGFAGEFGVDAAFNSSSSDSQHYKPAMVTVDQSGCAAGYVQSRRANINAVNKGDGTSALNPNCNYAASFNGTSAAAPVVTGVIALMLEANPNLTWREIRHILAMTARRTHTDIAPVTTTKYFRRTPFTLEQGWVQNDAGVWFHNYFGFGLVDASAAVAAAKTFRSGSLGEFRVSNVLAPLGSSWAIPSNSLTGLTRTFVVAGPPIVEQVNLHLYVEEWFYPYCNQIELTSPKGTKSILLNMDSSHTRAVADEGIRFLSNAFYGENPTGQWELKLINSCSATTPLQSLSTTKQQKLTVYGH